MRDKYEIRVSYGIDAFEFDPDEITSITGLKPSKVLRAGEPVSWAKKIKSGRVIPQVKYNSWELKSELEPLTDLDEHIRVLIQRLKPSWSEFVKLGAQYCGMFTCIVWDYSDARPAIFFDQDIVKDIAEINAGIKVSVHTLNE